MPLIQNVRVSTKEDKTLVSLKVDGLENRIFLTKKQVEANVGINAHFHVLRGSDIEVEFFSKGEKLYDGTEVTDDNKIVKEFAIEPSQLLMTMQIAGTTGAVIKL